MYSKCFVLFLFGIPAWMAINDNVVSVHHNGGFLPGIILTVNPIMLLPLGNPIKMSCRGFVFAAYDPT